MTCKEKLAIEDKDEEICYLRSKLYWYIGCKMMNDFIDGCKRKD